MLWKAFAGEQDKHSEAKYSQCHWKPASTTTDQDSCAIMTKMSVWCSQKKKKKVPKDEKSFTYEALTKKKEKEKEKKKRFHIYLNKSYIIW